MGLSMDSVRRRLLGKKSEATKGRAVRKPIAPRPATPRPTGRPFINPRTKLDTSQIEDRRAESLAPWSRPGRVNGPNPGDPQVAIPGSMTRQAISQRIQPKQETPQQGALRRRQQRQPRKR